MRRGERVCTGPAGAHRIAYTDWGEETSSDVVVCVHGLTRNSRDFDVLAEALSERCRVICIDVAGRGDSDWLTASEHYVYPQYVSDLREVMSGLDLTSVDWIGTSMGGILGMMIAAVPTRPSGG